MNIKIHMNFENLRSIDGLINMKEVERENFINYENTFICLHLNFVEVISWREKKEFKKTRVNT